MQEKSLSVVGSEHPELKWKILGEFLRVKLV